MDHRQENSCHKVYLIVVVMSVSSFEETELIHDVYDQIGEITIFLIGALPGELV